MTNLHNNTVRELLEGYSNIPKVVGEIEEDLEIWRCNLIYCPDTTPGKALARLHRNIDRLVARVEDLEQVNIGGE
jgi:hypothetical protein